MVQRVLSQSFSPTLEARHTLVSLHASKKFQPPCSAKLLHISGSARQAAAAAAALASSSGTVVLVDAMMIASSCLQQSCSRRTRWVRVGLFMCHKNEYKYNDVLWGREMVFGFLVFLSNFGTTLSFF